ADGYALVGGGLPGLSARLSADLPALVRLRAEREPLDGDAAEGLHAALVLPMLHRTEVTGLVLLAPKLSGDGYRPDEREQLARAARHVGLDLHALSIDALETEASDLKRDLAVVTGKFETLSLALKA
ncbi:hypothetical protein, partial [Caulobacter sp. 17J65-9]|uniref:hypothetical protein n=1 Tax=Caulobacter sp. 17J65-9 TaxID=2709382 RepID=UPI0013C856E9